MQPKCMRVCSFSSCCWFRDVIDIWHVRRTSERTALCGRSVCRGAVLFNVITRCPLPSQTHIPVPRLYDDKSQQKSRRVVSTTKSMWNSSRMRLSSYNYIRAVFVKFPRVLQRISFGFWHWVKIDPWICLWILVGIRHFRKGEGEPSDLPANTALNYINYKVTEFIHI